MLKPLYHCLTPSNEIPAYTYRLDPFRPTLLFLPVHKGGMGIHNPVESAEVYSLLGVKGGHNQDCAIKGETEFSLWEHKEKIVETHSKFCKEHMEQDQRKLDTVLEPLETMKMHAHESG